MTPNSKNSSIVAAEQFVRATRDSGYKSTASAISELVDNSLQAGAQNINIKIDQRETSAIEITVTDDGCGMDAFTLRQALRFGGSSRFDDRQGLGRFGMGLPNSSLSQARHVTVTSWTELASTSSASVLGSGIPLQTYLDADAIANGQMVEVPLPQAVKESQLYSKSGTVVRWTDCDRLDFKKPSTICRHLNRELARRFRYFLLDGISISVNGGEITPFDPLFLASDETYRSVPYGDEILYSVSSDPTNPDAPVGTVRVRFAELPVEHWASMTNEEKRRRGIIGRSGASIVRARREVDYGWFFFGNKRRENYDDWWRCEVHFDPVLDEAFGLTHTKQQIKPSQFLLEALSPDLEAAARVLNARTRDRHTTLKKDASRSQSEKAVTTRSRFLKPLSAPKRKVADSIRYDFKVGPITDNCFYDFQIAGDTFTVTIDPDHAFYRQLFLLIQDSQDAKVLRPLIELLVFAAARAEATTDFADSQDIKHFRINWGETLETLIGG